MAIFGKKSGANIVRNEAVARAVLVPSVSTMVSDGDVSDAELAQLSNACAFSPIFCKFSQEEMHAMIRSIISEISASGHPATIKKAAQALTPPLRETALCFAMRIALADGRVDDGEKNALSATGQLMQIPTEKFGQIFQFVVMMQRPAVAA